MRPLRQRSAPTSGGTTRLRSMTRRSHASVGAGLAALVLATCASACESDSATADQSADPSAPVSTQPIPPPPPIEVERKFPVPRLERLPSRVKELAGAPAALVHSGGALWAKSHRAFSLFKVDPATGKVLEEVITDELGCGDLVGGGGSVWVTGCGSAPDLVEVDERTGAVVSTSELTGIGTAIRSGELWIGDEHEGGGVGLWRGRVADLTRGQVVRVPGLALPTGVVALGDSIWVGDESSAVVYRIDPDSDRVRSAIPMPIPPERGYLIEHDGAPWYHDIGSGEFIRIDPRTEKLRRLEVRADRPTQYQGLGASTAPGPPGRLWVRSGDDEVWLIDTRADEVLRRIKVIDGGGGDVQQVGAWLWVASFGTDQLQRISLGRAG